MSISELVDRYWELADTNTAVYEEGLLLVDEIEDRCRQRGYRPREVPAFHELILSTPRRLYEWVLTTADADGIFAVEQMIVEGLHSILSRHSPAGKGDVVSVRDDPTA